MAPHFASFEKDFLGRSFGDAPLFLNDSHKDLHKQFSETDQEVSNPYNSILLWVGSQALDIEAIHELI